MLYQNVLTGALGALWFVIIQRAILHQIAVTRVPQQNIERGRQQAIALTARRSKRDLSAEILITKYLVHKRTYAMHILIAACHIAEGLVSSLIDASSNGGLKTYPRPFYDFGEALGSQRPLPGCLQTDCVRTCKINFFPKSPSNSSSKSFVLELI
jgi:hypothetical protein